MKFVEVIRDPRIKIVRVGPIVVAWTCGILTVALETRPKEWQVALDKEGVSLIEIR